MKFTQKNKRQSSWRIFRWPIIINIISLFGLIIALVGSGWLDLLSWLCLGGTVILVVQAYAIGIHNKNKKDYIAT